MKKLALVLTFVFGVAMIAPAFAVDVPKKAEVKKECTTDAKAGCTPACAKACEKAGKTCATPAKAAGSTAEKVVPKK